MIYDLMRPDRVAMGVKGSDRWGEGRGPRVDLVLATLAFVTVAGVLLFYVEGSALSSASKVGEVATVSTTGTPCSSPDLPQLAQQIEQTPQFGGLSGGSCYNYLGGASQTITFATYNGTIVYPCGTDPVQVPESEIIVTLTSSQEVAGGRLVNGSAPQVTCGRAPAVEVVSLRDVESTIPAVPQLNLTLSVPAGGSAVASLQASITLDGGSQVFKFGGVTAAAPLGPGSWASSTEIVLSNLAFSANEVYPVLISGTLAAGGSFSLLVHAQVAQAP